MNKSIIPVVVGIAILIFAIVVAIVTASTGESKIKQRTLSQKYVSRSISALKMNDINKAILHAKAAIKADPSNPRGFVCYKNAIAAKYKGLTGPKTSTNVSNPPAAAGPQMGC